MPAVPLARPDLCAPAVVLADSVSWQSPTGQPALEHVTIAIARAKTGLVGHNGSGKTTLALILAGELAPTTGSVTRNGTIALLPQDFKPLAERSVAQALGVQEKLAALARLTAAARAMRQELVDHARRRAPHTRGGGQRRVPLDEALDSFTHNHLDFLAIHEVLGRLAGLHARQGQVVELRFFGGYTMEDIAGLVGVTSWI
jgi:ATPase subunit of ABC transporter with duplicated ATPase domains